MSLPASQTFYTNGTLSTRTNSTATETKAYQLPFQTQVVRQPVLPATFFDHETRNLRIVDTDSDDGSVLAFIKQDLNISQLGDIARFSGYRGKPQGFAPSTSLYRLQYFFDRGTEKRIIVTEITALHLVYQKSYIFIKPLPSYLLSISYWERIRNSNDEELWINALGLLRSYAELVRSEMDFNVGLDASRFDRLLPHCVDEEGTPLTFPVWRRLVKEILTTYSDPVPQVLENTRWAYSCIRLGELNFNVLLEIFTTRHSGIDDSISSWFRHLYLNGVSFTSVYLQIALFVFASLALILSAMQVGLDTEQLAESDTFVRFCYGFVIFSMICPVIIIVHSGSYIVLALVSYVLLWPGRWKEGYIESVERQREWKRRNPRKSVWDSWYA